MKRSYCNLTAGDYYGHYPILQTISNFFTQKNVIKSTTAISFKSTIFHTSFTSYCRISLTISVHKFGKKFFNTYLAHNIANYVLVKKQV